MSNMNLPEWTAQALVAAGAVFLLISAYVMGVMVPNGLLAPNDFDVNYYFEGDIKTFDLDTETGTGAFVDDVGRGPDLFCGRYRQAQHRRVALDRRYRIG